MKYLKKNEGIFTGKAEKTFDKLIQDLEKRLTEGGYKFHKEPNKAMGSQLKVLSYVITDKHPEISEIEYQMKVFLIKKGTFDKPFVHAKVEGNQVHEGGLIKSVDSSMSKVTIELSEMELSENSLSIYGLLDMCEKKILLKNKREKNSKSFYDEFPIEDIKDRLTDLEDEFGINCEVSRLDDGYIGYSVDLDLNLKFKKVEVFEMRLLPSAFFDQGSHYIKVDDKMDTYSKVISELNNLSKVYRSMGLIMFFDPFYLINVGNINFNLIKRDLVKSEKDSE
jgi:hypothetical protein